MNNKVMHRAETYRKTRKKQKWLYRALSVAAAGVVFCTTYALILPAITMEGESAHIHSADCYAYSEVVDVFACPYGDHAHEEICYDSNGETLCGWDGCVLHVHDETCPDDCAEADFVYHVHDELCWQEDTLVCTLPEILPEEHRHTEECYAAGEPVCGLEEGGHTHDESCMGEISRELTCTMEEYEGHTHGDACYITEITSDPLCMLDHAHEDTCFIAGYILDCDIPESEGHTHGDECYTVEMGVVCEIPEEGHTHTEECYDRERVCGVETEAEMHRHTEDCFAQITVTYSEPVLICEKEGFVRTAEECAAEFAELVNTLPDPADDGYFDAYYSAFDTYAMAFELYCEEHPEMEGQEEFNAWLDELGYYDEYEYFIGIPDPDMSFFAETNLSGNDSNLRPIPDTVSSNSIKIHLFDYGSNINDDEVRVLNFMNSGDPGGRFRYLDGHGVYVPSIDANTRPIMSRLSGDDGYPNVIKQYSYDKDSGYSIYKDNRTGSLKYLFDKDVESGTGIAGDGEWTTHYSGEDTATTHPRTDSTPDQNIEVNYANLRNGLAKFDPETGYATAYRMMHFDLGANGKLFQKTADGYYEYDSAKNAAYFDGTMLQAYDALVAPGHTYTKTADNAGYAWYNFMPFDKPGVSNPVKGETSEVKTISDKNVYFLGHSTGSTDELTKNPDGTYKYAEYIDDDLRSSIVDTWYGMLVEFDFFIPKDGMIGDDQMIFDFWGDDDVWLYIDDVLVLDIGGQHGAQKGTVNFATGEVTFPGDRTGTSSEYITTTLRDLYTLAFLEKIGVYEASENTGNDFDSIPSLLEKLDDGELQELDNYLEENGIQKDGNTFKDYTKHSLKFYYMERGGNIGYCRLHFNLPALDPNSLLVTKELVVSDDTDEELQEYIESSLSYKFRVIDAENPSRLFVEGNDRYTIWENGVETGTGTVSADGTFALKAGQSAVFDNMLELGEGKISYIVQEIMPDDLTGQYTGVEYEVSGTTGEIAPEEGPKTEFTSFDTDPLSAEQSQVVTYRNKVDVSQLSYLKITKALADGASFMPDKEFEIQVKLGDNLIPVGTKYEVGDESRTVQQTGIIKLKIGETALILDGIISGTEFEVTELGTNDGGYKAAYSGKAEDKSGILENVVKCTGVGASGEFPLASMVHITVTNANYDFAINLPISKQVIENTENATFKFVVEQINSLTDWTVIDILPGATITVTDDQTVDGSISIGYKAGTKGIFYYKIYEDRDSDDFIFDETFYLVQINVSEEGLNGSGTAVIEKVLKNGNEEQDGTLAFVNRITTELLVTKTVVGDSNQSSSAFGFTVTVMLDGQPFNMPQPVAGALYSVNGNIVSFELKSGEDITIPNIPYNAVVTVKEVQHNGYIASYQVVGINTEPVLGDSVEITFDTASNTVHYTNKAGTELPETGGPGITKLYMFSALLIAGAAGGLIYKTRRRQRG